MATKKRVLLEFPEFDNSNLLERCSTYSLIGLETYRPILRIDDTFFVGTYADTVGSHVLIHIDDDPYDDKPTHDRIDAENDIETIHTKIIFKKVTLKPK